MEIPDRKSREDELAAALLLLFDDMRRRILSGLDPGWQRFEESVSDTLDDELAAIFLLMAIQLTNFARSSPLVDGILPGGYSGPAVEYATDRAAELARDIRIDMEKEVARIRRQFKAIEDITQDLNDYLDKALADYRAKRIAVTEITRVANHAEDVAAEEIERKAPVRMVPIWWTRDDELVCVICGPYHMKGAVAWANAYPSGPPAHVNCRCFKRYDIVPVAIRIDASDPSRHRAA